MSEATGLARAVVMELARAGVRHVVLCPGSRSAPLAYAVHDAARAGRLHLHVRHDERVAGFTAVGLARADGVPAAVVTTSGTAVANLHPAVAEAHHAGVPLLVLGADRPPRLRGTWANQTSDLQAEFFGAATRFAADLSSADSLAQWADAARAAVSHAQGHDGRRPGPAFLNLGFDEPLVPDDDDPWAELPEDDDDQASWSMTFADGPGDPPELGPVSRTVVLAGDGSTLWARRLAELLGVPLLAEPTSGARSGPNAVGPYRLLLEQRSLGVDIERVIVTGRPSLSRPVTRLIARPETEIVVVHRYADDPGPERSDVATLRQGGLAERLLTAAQQDGPATQEWLRAWREAGSAATRAIDGVLDSWPVLTGPLVAREVMAATRADDQLVLAASNPVRDADLVRVPAESRGRAYANRGLSGIDGTLATAIGVALANALVTRVLVGDVAFLHDLGALVLGPDERVPDLTVVVLNDAGGGIFTLLEPGADAERGEGPAERFERVFGTPHSVDIGGVCAAMGVPHRLVASAAGLRDQLGTPSRGMRVLEVRTERADLRPLHEAIERAVTAAVTG